MKAGYPCGLFGAHQALTGIGNTVVLLHSVVGCNFSTMAFHFTGCDMSQVSQTCTVISDSDVVFSGEDSLLYALENIQKTYRPEAVFVIQGCISDIIQDDIVSVCRSFEDDSGMRCIPIEAAGYRKDMQLGYEAALLKLVDEMSLGNLSQPKPVINLLGTGADDWRLRFDIDAFYKMLGNKIDLGMVTGSCSYQEVKCAAHADLNLVFGRGIDAAKKMKEKFNIPYEIIDYPYGLVGAKNLWAVLSRYFDISFDAQENLFRKITREETMPIYSWLQQFYGMPVAVIGTKARSRGLSDFLSSELGMEVEVEAFREQYRDITDFYHEVRSSEAALLFGSSFEQELADELGIPLVRFDYPVFDRVCISGKPYIGPKGTLCLIEDIFNEIYTSRKTKGALYK